MNRRSAVLAAIGLPIAVGAGFSARAQDRESLEATIASLETQVALLPTETPSEQPSAAQVTISVNEFNLTLVGVNVSTLEPGYQGVFADDSSGSSWIIVELSVDNPGRPRPLYKGNFKLFTTVSVAEEISSEGYFDLPEPYAYDDELPTGWSTSFLVFNTSAPGNIDELKLKYGSPSEDVTPLPPPSSPSPTSRLSQFELTVTGARIEADILGDFDTRYTSPDGAWLVVDATVINTGDRTERFEVGTDFYVAEENGVVWSLYGSADWYFDDTFNFTGPVSPGAPQPVTLLFSLVPEAEGLTLRHLVYGVNTPLTLT